MAGSFVDGVLSTVTRLKAAQTLVGYGADETAVVQCSLPACRVFYSSENPRCPRCGYPNPEPTMRTAKEMKCDDPTHARVDELAAPSAKRVTAKPKTNGRAMHWECTICHHEWQAGPAQVKCPQCNAGRSDLRASIEGDAHSAKPKAKGKIRSWPSGLDSWGTPTWCCPQCEHPHRQSVCPSECTNCGEEGDPGQSFKSQLPRAAFDRGPVPGSDHPAPPASGPTFADVELGKIIPSPNNPRKTFPQEELEELATSIEAIGIQEPLVVLPADVKHYHELVDGERRLHALRMLWKKDKAKWGIVRVEVRALSPQGALEYRLATFVRQGLNPIDQARAFQQATAPGGMTQEALGKLVGVTQGAIANKIRLLKAPEALHQKVITGEMTERQLRELIKWADVPGVLEKVAKELKGDVSRQNTDWAGQQAARGISRSMSMNEWSHDDRKFKTTPALEKELDVRKVGSLKRAFNTTLWDKLQKEAVAKKSKRADKADASPAKETAAELRAKAKKQAEIFEKRLYRYKIGWLQARLAQRLVEPQLPEAVALKLLLHFTVATQQRMPREEELIEAIKAQGGKKVSRDFWVEDYESLDSVDPTKLWHVARAALAAWVQHEPEGYHVAFGPDEIEALAKELGIDIKKEWRLDTTFLELHNKEQLYALCDEWRWVLAGVKRSELIDQMLANGVPKSPACPKELIELKGVKL